MGLFSKKVKEVKEIKLVMPIEGEITELSNVPDPVFAEKMMGDGFAIIPANGKVFAPCDGVVGSLFPTGHAIGLVIEEGIEILMHFGLETVTLQGEGFTPMVKQGDTVKAGDLLIDVDLEAVAPKVPSTITPVIFTDIKGKTFDVKMGTHAQGEVVCTIK